MPGIQYWHEVNDSDDDQEEDYPSTGAEELRACLFLNVAETDSIFKKAGIENWILTIRYVGRFTDREQNIIRLGSTPGETNQVSDY